ARYKNTQRVAEGVVGGASTPAGELRLRARNEGSWGNLLRASLTFRYTPLNCLSLTLAALTVAKGQALPAGTLLRLTLMHGVQKFRFVSQVIERGLTDGLGRILEVTLDQ